jgi:hypothetical protein
MNYPVLGGACAVIVVFWLTVAALNAYLPQCPQDFLALRLKAPFEKFGDGGAAYLKEAPELTGAGDTSEAPIQSNYLVCENSYPLGPAHSLHVDIMNEGKGRFSHWARGGFIFSASDNSDPNTNGRAYTVTQSCDRAEPAGLCGSWSGEVSQPNSSATYPIDMQLSGHGGHTSYPSAGCGGQLEFLGTAGTGYRYREHITYGGDKCSDGGTIDMRAHPSGDHALWDWTWTGAADSATAVLRDAGVGRRR